MNHRKSPYQLIVVACIFGLSGYAFAAEEFVIPGDHSKNLLNKVPLQISEKIEWNKSEKEKQLRQKILSILSDAELFIETPPKIEKYPDGQNGEVP